MGLYAEFSVIEDWGFPEELSGGDDQIGEASVFVDYGAVGDAFVSTFMEVALSLVPVDTGYLQGSLGADSDGMGFCWAEATAEYAEYVEYGTSYMDAQPYFEPALAAACSAAAEAAQTAVDEAAAILESILSSLMDAAMSMFGGGGSYGAMSNMSFGSWLGGMATFALMTILLFPILVMTYGVLDTIFNSGGTYTSVDKHLGAEWVPEIEIT